MLSVAVQIGAPLDRCLGAAGADVVVAPLVVAPVVATGGLEGATADVASQALALPVATGCAISTKCLILVIHVVSFVASEPVLWLLACSWLGWSCSELCFQLLVLLLKLFDTLSERLVDFFEGVIASVASNVATLDLGSAVGAGELDSLALVQPVQPERLFEVEHPICVGAPWNFAFDFVTA